MQKSLTSHIFKCSKWIPRPSIFSGTLHQGMTKLDGDTYLVQIRRSITPRGLMIVIIMRKKCFLFWKKKPLEPAVGGFLLLDICLKFAFKDTWRFIRSRTTLIFERNFPSRKKALLSNCWACRVKRRWREDTDVE